MASKVKLLRIGKSKEVFETTTAHALSILKQPKCGWELESKFVLENGTIKRKPKETNPAE